MFSYQKILRGNYAKFNIKNNTNNVKYIMQTSEKKLHHSSWGRVVRFQQTV